MNILTLETTCDETAAAVVTDELGVLGASIASQESLHRPFGGVVPEIASRAHVEHILPVIRAALRQAGLEPDQFDAVAIANTPGLAGSLLVGLAAAKALAVALEIPLIAINHLQAHIYACRMAAGEDIFPCVGLIVSGGHTSLYRCRGPLDLLAWAARLTTRPAKRSTKWRHCWACLTRAARPSKRRPARATRGASFSARILARFRPAWISASAA